MTVRIQIPRGAIDAFCQRWRVVELAIFGSALRDDFRPDSDIDILVDFEDDARWDVFDHIKAEDELREIFGRDVDLVTKKALRNPIRRHQILGSREVIHGGR